MRNLKVLVIDDENLICWSLKQRLDNKGYQVLIAETGEKGLQLFEQHYPDIVFIDHKLPGIQGLEVLQKINALNEESVLVFMTAYGTIEMAVKAIKLGAFEYINKPFSFDEIEVVLDQIKNKIKLDNEINLLRELTFDHIIGQSPSVKQIIQLSKKIARSEASTILLLGDSGTGKDLLAKVVHNESSRNGKPFVTINCASLPETLLESELFGYEKGAFTDAKQQKKGLFEIADGGTVFLDEIGEINIALQVKLLGIIENKTARRLGGTADHQVDVRIIAATNKDLKKSIQEKSFREDLYYRLKVFQMTLPSLRERKEDIPLLIHHFIKLFAVHFRKSVQGITSEAEKLLVKYDWPGNIRELRNVIERAIILETGETIQVESLPGEIKYCLMILKFPNPEFPSSIWKNRL
jgi:DNA-binding NtrC family response regulator